ncbi:MAG TPA: flagellar FlbD family protein [Angustibacter sp.]|nr:flagellar FlbD family protein [Angustibacter sp.]
MIQLTRLNGPGFALNPDLIQRAEATPDTVVTLVDGTKYVVAETVEQLMERVLTHRASVVALAQHLAEDAAADVDDDLADSAPTTSTRDRGTIAQPVPLHSRRRH